MSYDETEVTDNHDADNELTATAVTQQEPAEEQEPTSSKNVLRVGARVRYNEYNCVIDTIDDDGCLTVSIDANDDEANKGVRGSWHRVSPDGVVIL